MSRGPSGGVPDKGLWEKVEPAYPTTFRMPVPGGWIYYVQPDHREPVGMFVPEPPEVRALNCPKCHNERALDVHECPLKGTQCTCGVSCSGMCRLEKDQS